jgi:tetratricopeptide (TPR) repeat protein
MRLAANYSTRNVDHAGQLNESWLLISRALTAAPAPDPARLRRIEELADSTTTAAPDVGAAWRVLGIACFRTGELDRAISALDKSMAAETRLPSYDLYFLALCHNRLGRPDEALRCFVEGRNLVAKQAPHHLQLALLQAEVEAQIGAAPAKLELKQR